MPNESISAGQRKRLQRVLFMPARAVKLAFKNPLGRRVIAWMLVCTVGLATISTASLLIATYHRDIAQIELRLEESERSSGAGLAFAAWSHNQGELEAQLAALLTLPDIAYAELVDTQGQVLATVGIRSPDDVVHSLPVFLDRPRANRVEIGRLTAAATLSGVHARLQDEALTILAGQTGETLFISFMMLLIFRKLVSQPLSTLARAAHNMDPGHLSEPIELKRAPHAPDEFDTLVHALNAMRSSLKCKVDELELRVVHRTTELHGKVVELEDKREEQRVLIGRLEAAQSQALQSEKLASIGQLAAGVAHEINNPVGFVLSNFNSLERYVKDIFGVLGAYEAAEPLLPLDEPVVASLQHVKAAAEIDFLKDDIKLLLLESRDGLDRVRRIVRDLKDFSHVGATHWQRADLIRGLESTLNVVRNEVKYKADIVRNFADLPEIDCVPSQLNQVFMNLLVNAAHAIEGHGTITLGSGVQDHQVWIEISDSGSGIAPEVLSRIFDPFFTTKPVGQGTGLGLSLSYSIVRQHGGRIEVSSILGTGTTFRVWLPIERPEVPVLAEAA